MQGESDKQATFEKVKAFVQTLYDYNFVGTVTQYNNDEEDEMAIDKVSHSHAHGDQQLIAYSDIIGTVTEEDSSDKQNEMKIALFLYLRPKFSRGKVTNFKHW